MYLVGNSFRDPHKTITIGQISEQLRIPSIALNPIMLSLEAEGLLILTEKEELLPGREMSRIRLQEILNIVRSQGETVSDRPPNWTEGIDHIGEQLEAAISAVAKNRTLADLLDELTTDETTTESLGQVPAMVISSTRIEPQRIPPRISLSLPTAEIR